MVTFEVPFVPVAQPRQRHATRRTRNGKTFMVNYVPKDDPVHSFKAAVAIMCRQQMAAPLQGPVRVKVDFVFPRTANLVFKKKPMVRQWKDTKPDLDNLLKSTWDALKGIAWLDDSQICESSERKIYAAGDEGAKAIISIEAITTNP